MEWGYIFKICMLMFSMDLVLGETMMEILEDGMPRCSPPPFPVELKRWKDPTTSSGRRSGRSTLQQMKFEVHYGESVANSTGELIMNVTRDTVDLISRQLQVKQESRDILFGRSGPAYNNGTCLDMTYCGTATIPEQYLAPCMTCKRFDNGTEYDCESVPGGPEVRGAQDVHYVLFVTSLDRFCPPNVIGFASACFLDLAYNRPIAGFFNICPLATEVLDAEGFQAVIQHEIYHALGISSGLFGLYRDENGDPATPLEEDGFPPFNDRGEFLWSDNVARTITLEWDVRTGRTQRNVTMLVTPNIVREARDFYGCDTIEGVEIEDDYGRYPSGSALSHFESRIMPVESMAPQISPGRAFSRFSLAWLEDTGWYKVNYDLADPFDWGRDLGCGFVNQSCKWWMDTQRERGGSLRPYCEGFLEPQCSLSGDRAAICFNRDLGEALPEQYQYFESLPGYNYTQVANVGGISEFHDHCPVIYPFFQFQTNDYRRQACDKDIDECASNPCHNEATCSDILTGYFCTCTDEHEGRQCDHMKSPCSSTAECVRNEACIEGLCSCAQGRIRTNEGCQIPRRFGMRIQLREINGTMLDYPPSLNTSERAIRQELEYAIFNRLSRWEVFVDSVFSINLESFFNGSLGVEFAIVLDPGSSPDDVTIFDLMVDNFNFPAHDLSSGNTVYIWNTSSIIVQDLDECNETRYSACSAHATCINTLGSYQCTCQSGFLDQGNAIDGPGTFCTDIDECSNSSLNDCSPYARCNNNLGGYTCTCLSGYEDTSGVNRGSGRSCTDIDECISQPCFNGGECRNFRDSFTCECAAGFEGGNCETAITSCAFDDQCSVIGREFCSTYGQCLCRPGYYRRNGVCEDIAMFRVSLAFTTLNGSPLVYTSGLVSSSRNGFQQLAQQLRGALLSVIPDILDVSFTSFRSGSVIGEFSIVTVDGTSRNAVVAAVTTGLGDGTLIAGLVTVGVDPNSMVIQDLNECSSVDLNDCSPVANCTNYEGGFSCTCRAGYMDISPLGSGVGRVCERVPVEEGNSTSTIIILAIVLGIIIVIMTALIVVIIMCHLIGRKLPMKPPEKVPVMSSERFSHPNANTRHHSHDHRGDSLPPYNPAYFIEKEYRWRYRETRRQRSPRRKRGPVDYHRRSQLRTVSNAVYDADPRINHRFEHGWEQRLGQHHLAIEYPGHRRMAIEYPGYHRYGLDYPRVHRNKMHSGKKIAKRDTKAF